ncbi:translocator protein [Nematostella vectensis]|uniref:translocator protein n=1 Tax=Nematostella vectensis TaxID=45351 RepID=UPI0013903BF3|nr:translocator protein [Nematostella vectensis]XP_032237777.1 translocator protein [Nematostella vectensis]
MPCPAWLKIGGACVFPHIGGIAGGLITRNEVKVWYKDLDKPSWRPPNWAFGPVWTSLYTAMGYSSYLVWKEGGGINSTTKLPLILYGSQIVLNWAWTPLFFGAHKMGAAFVEILFLWGTVAGCIYTFYPISKLAAGLMVPYLAWVSLASCLNYSIWKRNTPAIKDE